MSTQDEDDDEEEEEEDHSNADDLSCWVEQGEDRREGSDTPPTHVSTPVTTTSSLTEAQLKKNRAIMTVLHFVLTYPRWSITLYLLLATITMPVIVPSMKEGLYQPLEDLRLLTKLESERYTDCVTDYAIVQLSRMTNTTVQHEHERSVHVRNTNRQLIHQVNEQYQICYNASVLARRSLQAWQLQRPIPWINNDTSTNTSCTNQDRDSITSLLDQFQDVSSIQGQVSSDLDTYLLTSSDTMNRLSQYAKARSTYDYNYFVGIKIQGVLDLINTFAINVTTFQFDIPSTLMIRNVTASLQGLLDVVHDMSVRVDGLTVRLDDFQTRIQGFYTQYMDLYSRLQVAATFVHDFVPSGITLPPALDLSGIPLPDSLLPPIWQIPNYPDLDLDRVISESLQNVVQLITDSMRKSAQNVSEQVRLTLEGLTDQVQDLLTLKDYDPPHYVGINTSSFESELEALRNFGQLTRQQVLSTLNAIQTWNDSTVASSLLLDWNDTSPSMNGTTSNARFEFLELRFPSFFVPSLFRMFFSWLWVMELIVQLVRLLRLRKLYRQQATIELPEINYLLDDKDERVEHETEQSRQSTLAVVQTAVLRHLLAPRTYIILFVLPLTIFGMSVWVPHVLNSCTYSRNGTIVAHQFLTPLMVNNATFIGDTKKLASQSLCRQTTKDLCDGFYMQSDVLYRQDLTEIHTITSRLRNSMDVAEVIARCVDERYIDEQLQLHCCGLEGYHNDCRTDQVERLCPIDNTTVPPASFRPVHEYSSVPACHNESVLDIQLDDSRFNCRVLDAVCDASPCTGVDTEFLRHISVEADCMVETHLLNCFLLIALSLYHCLALNLATTMAFRGVQRLRWRTLQPSTIQLRTHMDATGALVKGASVADRSSRIAVVMKRFEAFGHIQVMVSVVTFVCWIAITFAIRLVLKPLDGK